MKNQPALLEEFESAWAAWQAHMALGGRMQSAGSFEVYAHMWSALARWCAAQGVALEQLTPQRLEDYLAERGRTEPLSPRYSWRLLRLVERIVAHRGRLQKGRVNTAASDLLERRPEIRYANAQDADPLPEALTADEARRLVECLSTARQRPDGPPAQGPWQEVRNRCAVALQLGAGLTPGEVRSLVLAQLRDERPGRGGRRVFGRLHVPGDRSTPSRDTPIAPWAGALLGDWLTLRAALGIPGVQVFPSTRSTGKPWSKVSHYESVRKLLGAAGLACPEGGSYRLRHTFALRQLRRGTPPEEVARWLGVIDPGVMERYQRVLGHRPRVV